MAISTNDYIQENGGSDSDSNCTDDPPDYYQPISAVDDQEDVSDQENSTDDKGDHDPGTSHFDSFRPGNPNIDQFSNGFVNVHRAENGIAALQLNGDAHGSDDDEEEEERMTEASDSEIARAFREDESRRNAPVTPENAMRIMDAMRGVSFGGVTPDWASQVPEDRWVDQLRRLRQPPSTTATTTGTTQN
ncbi:uncharacterized protein LOC122085857 [Macadamia integrifolia]|uniref:uncharacterized protein LOC122085857 n=1 Tax=Macadamia integrifolia TaxID=60698 RepID=UPI001C4F7B1D|nr:uncharacterized protein LOC122085857 [Macadamia integrifolia]